jgi:7-carboxy-7-deazaguanine synthase
MLQRDIEELTRRLKDRDFHITIETAGTIDRDVECDLMSISPKMGNSTPAPERAGEWSRKHEQARHRPEVISKLIAKYDYQLKFVVKAPEDVDEIVSYLANFGEIQSHLVLLMPEGVELNQLQQRARWMLPICNQHGFTYCPRKHIEWYGNRRGT